MKTICFRKPASASNFSDYIRQIAEYSDELTGLNTYLSYYNITPKTEFLEDAVLMSIPDDHANILTTKFNRCRMFDFPEDDQDEELYDDFGEFDNEDFYEDDIDSFEELLNIFEY